MSDTLKTAEERAAEQRRGAAGATQRSGPPHMQIGRPTEKAMNFGPSARRLLALLRPERAALTMAILLTTIAVILNAIGPKILGRATDLIFAGYFGSRLPAGVSVEQAVAGLRAAGQGTVADMVAAMTDLVPGQGIDFNAVGQVLLIAIGLYVAASLIQWVQGLLLVGAVNRVIYTLRRDVEDKLHRLPLPYFDSQPRGDHGCQE